MVGMVPWWISHWRVEAAPLGLPVLRLVGGALLALGVTGLLDSFGRFAIQGIGTPAPVFPTRHLVVTGLYRYVRNPMYVAVVSAILGQGLILGNIQLLEYAGVVWLLFHLFVLIYEEPTLRATFAPSTRPSVLRSRAGFPVSPHGQVIRACSRCILHLPRRRRRSSERVTRYSSITRAILSPPRSLRVGDDPPGSSIRSAVYRE